MPSHLLILPAHNEAGNLPRVIPEARAAAPDFDMVVIDDGSRDPTAAVAASLGAEARQRRCGVNVVEAVCLTYGLGVTLMLVGFLLSRYVGVRP